MIEDNLVPPFNRMAGPAFKTELAIMRFVLCMADNTRRVNSLVGGILVAVETIQLIMSADQQESGCSMIKNAKFPTFRCMANATLVPHLVAMYIVFLMTRFACLRGVFEHLYGSSPGMALSTVKKCMQIFQLEGQTIVVKISPVGFYSIMAIQTGIPEQGNVIGHKFRAQLFMAGCAIRNLKAAEPGLMAIFTNNFPFPGYPAVGLK